MHRNQWGTWGGRRAVCIGCTEMDGVRREGCCNGYAACATRFTGCTETDGVLGGGGEGTCGFLCAQVRRLEI